MTHMSDPKDYFYAVGGQRKGPFKFDELKKLAVSGELSRTDKIWHKGMPAWESAGHHDELFADLPPDLDEPPEVDEPPPLDDEDEIDWASAVQHRHKARFMARERLIVTVTMPMAVLLVGLGEVVSPSLESLMLFRGLGLILYAGGYVQFLIVHYHSWAMLPPKVATTTPGKAVGFLFIPVFHFYWVFVSFYNLASDANRTLEALKVKNQRVNPGIGTGLAISWILMSFPEIWPLAVVASIVMTLLLIQQVAPVMDAIEEHQKRSRRRKS